MIQRPLVVRIDQANVSISASRKRSGEKLDGQSIKRLKIADRVTEQLHERGRDTKDGAQMWVVNKFGFRNAATSSAVTCA